MAMSPALQKTAGLPKALCFRHITSRYLFKIFRLKGPSMLPTLNESLVLGESISTRLGKVGSGDIVVIRSPELPTKFLTKRITAVGGDVVSYAPNPKRADLKKTVVVPKGHVWVEGDNPRHSRDSRHFGAVPYTHIRSRVFFVLWPPSDCRLISNKIA